MITDTHEPTRQWAFCDHCGRLHPAKVDRRGFWVLYRHEVDGAECYGSRRRSRFRGVYARSAEEADQIARGRRHTFDGGTEPSAADDSTMARAAAYARGAC